MDSVAWEVISPRSYMLFTCKIADGLPILIVSLLITLTSHSADHSSALHNSPSSTSGISLTIKFSLGSILLGMAAITGVRASPVPASDVVTFNDNVARASHALAVPDDLGQTANAGTNKVAIVPRDLGNDAASGLSKRAINSFFKIHVVNAAGRVLSIIVIDYVINQLPGNHEGINAFYDKLTNVKVNGEIVATHFENGENPFKTAQNAVFDFSTKVVSSVIDLSLDASGTTVRVVSTTGIELGNLVVAKALHIFNDKNQKIGSVAV